MRHKITLALLAVSIIATGVANAEEDWPWVRVSCNNGTMSIVVEEDSSPSKVSIPNEPNVQSLDDLTELRTGELGDYRVATDQFVEVCVFENIRYTIRIRPWKFNEKINGMCGGYSPSSELTVWRDGKHLLGPLVYGGYCNPPDSDISIPMVTLLEKEQVAVIKTNSVNGMKEHRIKYQALPEFTRKQLLERK